MPEGETKCQLQGEEQGAWVLWAEGSGRGVKVRPQALRRVRRVLRVQGVILGRRFALEGFCPL
jgi:hypothetical protein